MKAQQNLVLPIIVFAQFCCTSLWFAGNAILNDLIFNYQLPDGSLGYLTSAVQLGFICGTLSFAVLMLADRYAPSKVFFVSALLGATCNLGLLWTENSLFTILTFRFLTGFFLAGIYPVGMKIAADYYEKGLGKALGFLVGALVLGTALPHLLRDFTDSLPWSYVIILISVIATIGGTILVSLVPNGPYRKAGQQIDLSALFVIFKRRGFRQSAFGYFGHMWELYTFWAFVPYMLQSFQTEMEGSDLNISLLSFFVIGIGGVGCILAGYLAQRFGSKRIATLALCCSGCCCLLSPLVFMIPSSSLFIGFLCLWGIFVIADSPLFSTLVAQNSQAEIKGTALTLVNCIGFFITIVSIQIIS